jgi:hypothetical protein
MGPRARLGSQRPGLGENYPGRPRLPSGSVLLLTDYPGLVRAAPVRERIVRGTTTDVSRARLWEAGAPEAILAFSGDTRYSAAEPVSGVTA